MDARRFCTVVLAVMLLSGVEALGAGARTRNFVVQTANPHFAQQVAQLAERYRHDLAVDWLGHELPPWPEPCPVTVHAGQNMGAGGATSFCFRDGQPFDWRMTIQGPPDRLLDSVLPHEVLHTVFATHFGCPLPRWADEGACTTIEHTAEKAKYHRSLLEALTTGRGIPFNQMFAMKEYPRDVLPLYAQGHSLAKYLIAMGGKQRYVTYVGDGMQWNNWTAATKKHYGFSSLSELQVTWNQWVAQGSPPGRQPGSPELEPIRPPLVADQRGDDPRALSAVVRGQNEVAAATYDAEATDMQFRTAGLDQNGWYSRNRQDALRARQQLSPPVAGNETPPYATGGQGAVTDIGALPTDRAMSRPQQPQTPRQIFLEGGYPQPPASASPPGGYGNRPGALPATAMPPAYRSPGPPAAVPSRVISQPMPGQYFPTAQPMSAMPSYLGAPCFGSS